MKIVMGMLIAVSALVTEASSLTATFNFNGQKFQSQVENLPTMVRALEQGFPLLYRLEEKDPASEWKGVGKTFDEAVANAKANLEQLNSGYKASLQKTAEMRKARLQPATGAAPSVVLAPAAAVAVAFSWNDFCRCARPALAALKIKRRLQLTAPGFDLFEVESTLAEQRGDGKVVSAGGIACGRHLGEYGYKEGSINDEIATVAALALPNDAASFENLVRIFSLYRASLDGKSELPYLWQYAWKRARFARIVRSAAPAEIDTLIANYLAYSRTEIKQGENTLRFQLDEAALTAKAKAEWNALKGPEVKPCGT